ncbi:MAG: hypothetical protein GEU79_12645 [Acidimicrobiia bacterium]|nr:hypothetical protein [Acidimicrobiia bacterium]
MVTSENTVDRIASSSSWNERVSRIRQIPQLHGTDEHQGIYAQVAQAVYVPHLSPDFAYIHEATFYEQPYFDAAYKKAVSGTEGFSLVDPENLAQVLTAEATTLLVFRTILGLTKGEFAASTAMVAQDHDQAGLTTSKVDNMEKLGTVPTEQQAVVAANTIHQIMTGALFGEPRGGLRRKQKKLDTEDGWDSVRHFEQSGVGYSLFLHQRHYGGSFRQVLDATSEKRGNLIEDSVEELFIARGIPYIRTGSHNQSEIGRRFKVAVRPAPDFVIFDDANVLRGMLECKGANDGGTARDKALRFARLREESVRLGGVPLIAVLSGLGWTRVNDTLGPVVRDCDGRVFTLANLPEMLTVQPFPPLIDSQRANKRDHR